MGAAADAPDASSGWSRVQDDDQSDEEAWAESAAIGIGNYPTRDVAARSFGQYPSSAAFLQLNSASWIASSYSPSWQPSKQRKDGSMRALVWTTSPIWAVELKR